MKIIRILVFFFIFISLLLPLTQVSSFMIPKQTTKFALIFTIGGRGDKSFNDAAYRGIEQAKADYGNSISIDYIEPENIPEFYTFQDDLARNGDYELIICVGYLQYSALNATARDYPDQDWAIIDEKFSHLPNVQSFTFKEQEGSFLVGAMAGMVTQTSKIGFLGGIDIYLINKFRYGYEQGAKYINPAINVTATYMPVPPPACWNDPPTAKLVGENLYSQGIDIIYTATGESYRGVFQAANETSGVFAIGADYDQDGVIPGKILCSMIKKYETAVYTAIKTKMDGSWAAGTQELGLAEDGVAISPMTFTGVIKNGQFTLKGVSKTRWEHILEIKELISEGYIIVSDDTPWYSTTTPTPVTTTTNSQSTTHSNNSTSKNTAIITPSTHIAYIILTLSLVVPRIRLRKKKRNSQ